MSLNPKVTVIIPVFNRENLIQRSINSVLNQTYKNLEVIVVDDASTDRTAQKISEVKDDRLKYIGNEVNLGPSQSRNKGIEISDGELIAFQDSDDEWHIDKLAKQVQILIKSNSDVAAVYCKMEFVDSSSGKLIAKDNINAVDFRKTFTHGTYFLTPANVTVLIKKSVLNEVGYFDESLFAMEDTELAIRVSKNYNYRFIDEPLVRVTRNHNQLTENAKNYIAAKEILYKKHKNYLSTELLFEICKEIANYYILIGNIAIAKNYLKKSFSHGMNVKTLLQYISITLAPSLLKYLYHKKYSKGIPHPNKEGEFLPQNK